MRQYFFHLLQNLDKLTGIRQFDKLSQTEKPKEELNLLLDILCRVCDQFPYIPDKAKMKIIDACVVTEAEFIGLNARVVYKWLNANKDIYFKEAAHQQQEEAYEPLTGEAREKRLKEWMEAHSKAEMAMTERVSPYKEIREQWRSPDDQKYTPRSEAAYEHERHLQYIRRNYDAKTGEKLPDWIPEDEFNKLYNEGLI